MWSTLLRHRCIDSESKVPPPLRLSLPLLVDIKVPREELNHVTPELQLSHFSKRHDD
jgi:hypothetical protein